MPAEYRAQIEAGRPRLYAIAEEQYGLKLNQGPFGISSRLALVGAEVARALGRGKEFHWAVLRAYWAEGQDISQLSVLIDLAESVGLDRDRWAIGVGEPDYDRAVQADVDLAAQYGLSSVPAIVFEMRYLVSGAQPYATLMEVTQQVATELAAGDANA